jgi:hypothetical protein
VSSGGVSVELFLQGPIQVGDPVLLIMDHVQQFPELG